MPERISGVQITEKKEVKSKVFKKKQYFVSTLDRRLRGDNQENFVAHQEQRIIDGKKKNIYIPEENVLLYLGGYKTIREGIPVIIKKLK